MVPSDEKADAVYKGYTFIVRREDLSRTFNLIKDNQHQIKCSACIDNDNKLDAVSVRLSHPTDDIGKLHKMCPWADDIIPVPGTKLKNM